VIVLGGDPSRPSGDSPLIGYEKVGPVIRERVAGSEMRIAKRKTVGGSVGPDATETDRTHDVGIDEVGGVPSIPPL